jgi:flagellar biosynthesis protein FlhG
MNAPPKSTSPRPPAAGPVIAIASGKGGVGKTWLSVTLASAFARRGRRTLLIDGDFGLANVDVQLGIRPQADLAAVMRGWIDLEAAVTPVMGGAGRPGGFDLLPGHSGSGALATLRDNEVERLAQGVRLLAKRYQRVILDIAAGVDLHVMRLAQAGDRVLAVTTEEPTALTDVYAFIKVLRVVAPQTPSPFVAVNMSERRSSGIATFEQLAGATEAHLGFRPQLAGIIPRDPAVPDAIRAKTALALRHPGSAAFDAVMKIAEAIAPAKSV